MADLREQVRAKYAKAATEGCCGSECGIDPRSYDGEAPAGILSLGCGNPVAVADLREGETVLDLGSGGGLDVILSGTQVGPTGTVYGLDMTDEMLALAQRNAAAAEARNVHFLKGHIEAIPLPANSVDVVISNCVINLSTDKQAVFRELARVVKPGGRIGISDVVAENHLLPSERMERGSYVGCIAGALSKREYEDGLVAAGFGDVTVEFTYEAADGMHSAIIRAVKPGAASGPLPVVASTAASCC